MYFFLAKCTNVPMYQCTKLTQVKRFTLLTKFSVFFFYLGISSQICTSSLLTGIPTERFTPNLFTQSKTDVSHERRNEKDLSAQCGI